MQITVPTTFTNILHIFTDHNYINTLPTPTTARRTPTYSPREDITAFYPQIHGDGDLSSLLDPLHPCLRREIIKYGEFAQATYDSFDFNPFSEYCGSCHYNHHKLFDMLNLSRNGYDVTSYVYAMSHVSIIPKWIQRSIHSNAWSNDSNWMGYVGVSNDMESKRIGSRDIVVAWRGTIAPLEWVEDIQVKLEHFEVGEEPDHDVKVEHGFLSVYTSKSETTRYNKTSASEQVMKEIRRLVNFYKGRGERVSLTITGHSLGGALALLNAYEAALTVPDLPVTVITFGGPRVGNASFKEKLKDLKVKVLRVVVKQDVVPKVPGVLFNEGLERIKRITGNIDWVYTHVGLELGLNSKISPYLKHHKDLGGHHNLETYLHLVDGFLSTDSGFREKAKRDFALVNKSTGMLKESLKIPESWNQLENKGLIRNAYGRWVLHKREQEDIPSPFRNGPSSGKFGSIAE